MLSKIKRIIGDKNYRKIKSNILFFRDIVFRNNRTSKELSIIVKPNCDLFCGYYDIPVFDKNCDKLLAHNVYKNGLKHICEIGYIEIENKEFKAITTTKAWCWQMGARLRWSIKRDCCFYFNDYDEMKKHYVTKRCNYSDNTVDVAFDEAFFDFNEDKGIGVSIDFDRLQRLRPGYGYCVNNLENAIEAEEDTVPKIALKIWDLSINKCVNCLSFEEINRDVPEYSKHYQYINHVSFSPDGSYFIFFHVISFHESWKARLFVYNTSTDETELLEGDMNVSHYTWKNNSEVLITADNYGCKGYYLYNVITKKRSKIDGNGLDRDGHPSFISDNAFISDTYPNAHDMQELFRFNIETGKRDVLCELYHSPLRYGERRCDLHPKVSKKFIAVDNLSRGRNRSIALINIKEK